MNLKVESQESGRPFKIIHFGEKMKENHIKSELFVQLVQDTLDLKQSGELWDAVNDIFNEKKVTYGAMAYKLDKRIKEE